jgi:plasmid stability protein
MPTITVRNVPPKVVRSLKALARENRRSMEQEVRALLQEVAGDRRALLEQIEAAWAQQPRRPSASEIEAWIDTGR